MAYHSASPRITLHPHSRRGRILDGDTLIADSCNAIELRERGYPSRHYLLGVDVGRSKISVSASVMHCSCKRIHPLLSACCRQLSLRR